MFRKIFAKRLGTNESFMKKVLPIAFLASLLTACVSWVPTMTKKVHDDLESVEIERVLHPKSFISLQGYYADGSSVQFLDDWRVTPDSSVIGSARYLNAVGVPKLDEFLLNEIEAQDIELWRTSRKLNLREKALFSGSFYLVAADAALGIYCLTVPKACFGSCPTFYQGESDHLFHSDAEGFTNAILPSLEHKDIDALPEIMYPGSEHITMKNEALETHNINEVVLLSVPKLEGTEVLHAVDDRFYRTRKGPELSAKHDGIKMAEVEDRDGLEWFVPTHQEDLAHKTHISISTRLDPSKKYGLQLTYRQTLLSTYLFYSTLENMGGDYGRRMAIMNHNDAQKKWLLKGGLMKHLGPIEVRDVKGKRIGAFEETGPIAQNTQLLPLEHTNGQIELELTQGLWRIDHMRIVEIVEEVAPKPHRITFVEMNNNRMPSEANALNSEGDYLVSLPGEERVLHFEALPSPSHVFLSSKGYYLEWSRTSWNDPGQPRALNKMLLQPRQFLRDEAEAFKVYENEMEPLFWSSKLNTPILTSHEK